LVEGGQQVPAISAEAAYEAALGNFLVRFNRIEYLLAVTIRRTLRIAGLAALGEKLGKDMFVQKLAIFELIARDRPPCDEELVPRLRKLAERRNVWAHGHLDVDPFDGALTLFGSKGVKGVEMATLQSDVMEADALIQALLPFVPRVIPEQPSSR